jgi:Na+-transporting NADH:ubiquinone oxidoreductase subunit NqrE
VRSQAMRKKAREVDEKKLIGQNPDIFSLLLASYSFDIVSFFFLQVQKNKRQTSEFEVKDYFQLSFLQLINFLKKIMNLNQIESLLLSLVSPVLCPKRFIFLFSFNPLKLSILICFHSDWIYFLRPFNI